MNPILQPPFENPLELVKTLRGTSKVDQCLIMQDIFGVMRSSSLVLVYYDMQRHYIDMLFSIVNVLYEYYELGSYFFDSLNTAATQLEKFSIGEFQQQVLPEYFEKTAMIYQIAADKTEIKKQRIVFRQKAILYVQKANDARMKFLSWEQVLSQISHEEQMYQLFQKAAKNYFQNKPYNVDYFQLLAGEYRKKYSLPRLKEIKNSIQRQSINFPESILFLESLINDPINETIRSEARKILKQIHEQQSNRSHRAFSFFHYEREGEITEPLLQQESKKTK